MFRLIAAAALAACLVSGSAEAQDRPLRIILGFPAGGGFDTMTRLVADHMRGTLGRTVVGENKTGAAGIVANEAVKAAAPDGSTLLMTPFATMVAYPHSYTKLNYDVFKDYVPVAHMSGIQIGLAIGPNVPAKTVKEYVAFAKQGGQNANFASAGAGSLPHFFGVLLGRTAGVDLVHVPYRGTAPVLAALAAGEIPAAVLPLGDIAAAAEAGRARVLASSGAQRAPGLANVPTFREAGFDLEATTWYALYAPAGTPADMIATLARAAIAAVHNPEINKKMLDLGLEPTGLGPAELAAIHKADYDKWGPPIRASGFKADQ
jgi:tripartite-type tricarboxylate transporter receptor subunit TctC